MRVHIVLKTKDLYDEGQQGFRTTVDSVWENYEKADNYVKEILGGYDPFSDTKYEIITRIVKD
jgi:hypothetical protein